MENQFTPIKLNTGKAMPQVGLGVFRTPADVTYDTVSVAIKAGYRHIDTAQMYGNEEAVGEAVRDSGLPKSEIFVTTKVMPGNMEPGNVERSVTASISALGFVPDLVLLHWPVTGFRIGAWSSLEQMSISNQIHSIGVSNFMWHHLKELLDQAKIVPAVNQIELSPFLQQRDTRALCKAAGIAVAAYSPLTKGRRLDQPVLLQLAQRYKVSTAQILLRWGLQSGFAVIPKSVREERMIENISLTGFHLIDSDMALLNSLEENFVTGWNPQNVA